MAGSRSSTPGPRTARNSKNPKAACVVPGISGVRRKGFKGLSVKTDVVTGQPAVSIPRSITDEVVTAMWKNWGADPKTSLHSQPGPGQFYYQALVPSPGSKSCRKHIMKQQDHRRPGRRTGVACSPSNADFIRKWWIITILGKGLSAYPLKFRCPDACRAWVRPIRRSCFSST